MAELIYAGDGGAFKTCTKCSETKSLNDFGPRKTALDGKRSNCRACDAVSALEWSSKNPEKKKLGNRLCEERKRRAAGVVPIGIIMNCYKCGAECERTSGFRKYCDKCAAESKRESHKAANSRYEEKRAEPRKRDPEKRKIIQARFIERNPDYYKERSRLYNEVNREDINRKSRERNKTPERKAYMAEWDAQYRAQPKQRLDQRMKTAIKLALKEKKAGRTWESIVGYTLDELRVHIEKQFLRGMSWDNIGEWHIDHIRPRSSFEYEDENDEAFKECWALTNLRPLWWRDNISKGGKRLYLI